MKRPTSGFTLIELLIVIAIVGTLSAIVLNSLRSARLKTVDAAIKSNLANLRLQAELYLDGPGGGYYSSANLGFTTVSITNCGCTTSTCGTPGTLVNSIFDATPGAPNSLIPGITAAVTANGGTAAICRLNDSTGTGAKADRWAVQTILKNSSGSPYWCVDSTGASRTYGIALPQYYCP